MPSGTLRSFWKKNKKVGAAVKAPMNAKSLLKKLAGVSGQAELTQLVSTYENIDPANDPDCSLRMTALRDIDVAIYKWFNHTSSDSLSNVKGAKAMVSLLKKAEQAHEQLVEATRNDPNVVPFDTTNLSQQEILDRTAVWRSVVDGTGQVQLGGSEKFQKKTRAQMAKMLQTETGYNILNYLSTPQGDNPAPEDRLVLGDKLPDDLSNKNHLTSVDRDVSYAKELTATDTDKDLESGTPVTGNEDPNEFPTLTGTGDLQKAIFAGKKGVIVSGKKYTFAKGSGAFVKTVPPRKGDEDSDTAGVGNTEIITPSFITLAHELGHAVNIRGGAVTRNHPELMVALCKTDDPSLTDQDIEDRWSNGEEYFTISNIENGMRKESGIPLRSAHKPRTALVKMALLKDLDLQAAALQQQDLSVGSFPEAQDLAQYLKDNKGQANDDRIMKEIVRRIDRLKKVATVVGIEDFKRNDLLEYRKELDRVFQAKRTLLQDDDPLVKRYSDLDDKLKNGMDNLVEVGTDRWQKVKDEIRNLRFDLNKVAVPQN